MDTAAARQVLDDVGIACDIDVRIDGDDPVVASPHRLGRAAATALAAQGAAAAALWRMRGGAPQTVRVAVSDAVDALDPGSFLRQNGYHPDRGLPAGPSSGYFPTADGRLVLTVGPRAGLRDGLLNFFDRGHNTASLTAATLQWRGQDLEDALAQRGLAGSMVRSPEEWRAHPQGQWLAAQPLVRITRIGDSAPEAFTPGPSPLSGIRVLDVAHIIAGPVAGRSLAEYGADVLRISSIRQPDDQAMVMDTGFGKRAAFLDLENPADQGRLTDLARASDLFLQSYRPGSLAKRGLDPARLAAVRPGIIYVSVSCYGDGPWEDRVGFDNNAQAVTGISVSEGGSGGPRAVPTHLLNDCLAGYLASTGAMAALMRRAREGGSYLVEVSLARTAMWVQEFGLLPPGAFEVPPPRPAPKLGRMPSVFGDLDYLRPPVQMSLTPPQWRSPPVPLGSSKPVWLPRDVSPAPAP